MIRRSRLDFTITAKDYPCILEACIKTVREYLGVQLAAEDIIRELELDVKPFLEEFGRDLIPLYKAEVTYRPDWQTTEALYVK